MAKAAGLGDNFYIGGYDLSGDVSSIGQLGGGPALLDVTALKQLANARIGGLRSADWQFTSFFENAVGVSNPGVPGSTVPLVSTYTFAVLVTVIGGTVTNVVINGVSVGTGDGTYVLPALGTITLTYSVAPTWTWTAIGTEHNALAVLPTADAIAMWFHGTALQNTASAINAKQINYDPTRDNTGNLTVAVELQSNGFGCEFGEMLTAGLRTDTAATVGPAITDTAQTAFGAQAYIMLTGFVGTSVTIAITHCTTVGGSYTTLLTTSAMTAIGAQRVVVSNVTTVDQFLKVTTTGTFSYAQFAVVFCRNSIAGQVF